MYTKVSIPKTSDGAGCAVPKNPNVIVIFAEDVTAEPVRAHGNIEMSGNFTLKTGAKAIGIYLTPSTIAAGYDTEGEVDGRGFKHKVEGEHPGNDKSLENFVEGAANKGVIVLVRNCDGTSSGVIKAYGSVCNPMFLTPESTDSKDGNKTKLSFAQEMAQKFLPGIYSGTMPDLADPADDDSSESA